MNTLNSHKVGLTLGFFVSGVHLIWSVLVAFGWAQALMDFILWAHMVHIDHVVGPFDLTAAATLVVVTFAVGYIIGSVFARIWNHLHKA